MEGAKFFNSHRTLFVETDKEVLNIEPWFAAEVLEVDISKFSLKGVNHLTVIFCSKSVQEMCYQVF